MPPPMHIDTTTCLAPRRLPSIRMWPLKRAPVMPKGWPIAIEPPLTLNLAGSMPSLSREYRHWLAKASFNSHKSMSSIFRPWRASSRGIANTGPMPISSGWQPATAQPLKAPSGCSPRRSASLASISTTAAPPSASWLALPAVMKWPAPRTGSSLARPANEVSGRLHSSRSTTTSTIDSSFVTLSITFIRVLTGMISSLNLPAAWAAAIKRCDCSEYSSWYSRLSL